MKKESCIDNEKRKEKDLAITITILSLAVIGVVFASFMIAHRSETPNPIIETTQPIGDLQDYDFSDFEPIWGKMAFPGEYNKEKDVLVDYAYNVGDHTTVMVCGHLACADGEHGAASCNIDGHYACDKLNHGTAACGKHFICDKADHAVASCGNSGIFHGEGAGSCHEWANYVCKGCNINIGDAGLHKTNCFYVTGHYTCIDGESGHAVYECGSHASCIEADTVLDHSPCQHCGKRKCEDDSEHDDGVCTSGTI